MTGYNEDIYVVDGNDFYCVAEDACDDAEFARAEEDEFLYCDGVDYEEQEEGLCEAAEKYYEELAEKIYEESIEGFFEKDDAEESVIGGLAKIA